MSSKTYTRLFPIVMIVLLIAAAVVSCKGLHFAISHNITLKVDRDKKEPARNLKDTVYVIDTVFIHKKRN